jgi:Peptidase family M49
MTVSMIARSAAASLLLTFFVACAAQETADALAVRDNIKARVAQFVPQHLNADMGHLSRGDRDALDLLIEASDVIDALFQMQAWATRAETDAAVALYEGPSADAVRDYYDIMRGPWDRLLSSEPWMGTAAHPEGAGYYPEDMTEEEFEAWLEANPNDADAFRGLHTVIRRQGERLIALPYSEAYGVQLREAADLLRQAAEATTDESLATFLSLRADALLSDDYYESDMAWMDLSGDLEVVFGPYETYEDGLFGYKAAFESFLCVVNPADSRALDLYKSELPWLERNLPIADEHKNLDRGSESPIRVADEVYTAGDTRSAVQTIAFNLPNDERVREAKGSKKVMLKNVIQAKYDAILVPIAKTVMSEADAGRVDFQAYFDFVLHHELSHGLGPGKLVIDGRETEVRLELKDLYSALEEAKADVLGMYNIYSLIDKGVLPPEKGEHLSWTVVPGLFRSARFGVTEAHGLGVLCQFNYLAEKGALSISDDGLFAPVESKWRDAVRDLAHDLLMLQANANYDEAKAWVEKYGAVSAPMQKALDALVAVPVDVRPIYDIARKKTS